MKLLVVSFPCVTPINQGFYAEVEKQTDWDLTIVAPSNWESDFSKTDELERWPGYDGELISIPVWLPGNIPLHVYRSTFYSILRQVAPDAIYVHHEAYGLATAQLYFANWMWAQKPIGFYSAQNICKQYPVPFRYSEQFVYRQSAFSFPVTEAVLQILQRKGYRGPSTILPLGVDESLYHPRAPLHPAELNASANEVLIGYVGRITESKGLGTLVHSLGDIKSLPWRLVLIGKGPYEEELKRLAQSLDVGHRISALGYVSHPDVPQYLSTLDVLVLPSETQSSWKEQFGRVIIEAMACGTPVVGSDSGEIPNLIRATGGGLVFPERNSQALADRLQTLIEDPDERQRLAAKGRQSVAQDYTLAPLARRFAATVEESVANHAVRHDR